MLIIRNVFTFCILCFFLVFFFPSTSHAGYLDPGSGSTLVQGIIAVIAAAKRFWRKLIGIFTGKKD